MLNGLLTPVKKAYGLWLRLESKMIYLFLERPRGLDFSKDAEAASAKNADMREYKRTPLRLLRLALREMPPDRRGFLDIGCGKGYVLSAVKKHSEFTKVGGIEYDEEIAEICRRNLARLGCTDVDIWAGDARDFERYRDYDTFFFFNPFSSEIFRTVLERISAKNARIIYVNPVCSEVIENDGRFRLVKQLRAGLRSTLVHVYEGIPEEIEDLREG